MDQPVVSGVALRLALTRLIEAVGGMAASEVQVASADLGNEKMYAALVPIEYRAEVHHYIAERSDLPMPLDGGALTLNSSQALKVIGLAYGSTQSAIPSLLVEVKA
jgi:hypothetical protein